MTTEASDRQRLERLVEDSVSEAVNAKLVPQHLKEKLERWNWGKTGWTSPTNLIITAAWRKAFYPTEDCCKIWARDSKNKVIPGSYSIRTSDETVTVPVFSKHDLCTGFCSSNSGMQGTRAIEKSRGIGRINRNLKLDQRTIFDSQLFAEILNDINELREAEALETLKYLISIAHQAKRQRELSNNLLRRAAPRINLLEFSALARDPELTKCITAACLDAIYGDLGFEIEGVRDFKTAADGRAEKAGDLMIRQNGRTVIAIEVKDRSRSLDWHNVNNAKKIINNFPDLKGFYFVLESRSAAHDLIIGELSLNTSTQSDEVVPMSFIALPDLVGIAAPIKGYEYLVDRTAYYVSLAPSIKPSTKQRWIQHRV